MSLLHTVSGGVCLGAGMFTFKMAYSYVWQIGADCQLEIRAWLGFGSSVHELRDGLLQLPHRIRAELRSECSHGSACYLYDLALEVT